MALPCSGKRWQAHSPVAQLLLPFFFVSAMSPPTSKLVSYTLPLHLLCYVLGRSIGAFRVDSVIADRIMDVA